jgi:hypothetical protein
LTFNREKDEISPFKSKSKPNLKCKKSSGKENKKIVISYDQEGGILNIADH